MKAYDYMVDKIVKACDVRVSSDHQSLLVTRDTGLTGAHSQIGASVSLTGLDISLHLRIACREIAREELTLLGVEP